MKARNLGMSLSAVALGGVFLVAAPAGASTNTGTQTATASVIAPALSLSFANSSFSLTGTTGNSATAGGGTVMSNSGNMTITDGITPTAAWSVSVAATDLMSGSNKIPFTAFGPWYTGSTCANSSAAATVGCTNGLTNAEVFAGTDTTPGTTFSSPINGIWTEGCGGTTACATGSWVANTAWGLTVPAGTPAGNYSGTIQYTITG